MGTNLIGELVANNGTYFLQSGTFTGAVDQVIVRGQGIKISIYINNFEGEAIDVTNQYLQNGRLFFIPDGLRITPKNDNVFTSVKIEINDGYDLGSGLELVLA
jgi:hypothetical protein